MRPQALAIGIAIISTPVWSTGWAASASPSTAGGQVLVGDATDSVLGEGIWVAKRRFGPDVRGRLMISGAEDPVAEIAGFSVRVRRSADSVSFELPDSAGWFAGMTVDGGRAVRGHWFQPRTVANGTPYASPLTLARDDEGRWVGDVVPLDDEMTMFIRVTRRANGALAAFIRNPERNIGRQLRAERIEVVKAEVHLIGRRNGTGAEQILARGPLRPNGFSLFIPGRGGSFDFRRIGDGEYTDYYPRGYPDAWYTYRPPPRLDDGWEVGTLESVGLSTDSISAFVRAIIGASMDSLSAQQVHALLIARHGRLVLEEYFHGHHRDFPHDTRSAAKSITATLAGAAIAKGALRLDSPAYATFHGGELPVGFDPAKRGITVDHFLGMASGIDCDDRDPASPGGEETILDQEEEPDYYRIALGLRTVRPPGREAIYCSIQPHFVGGIVKAVMRQPLTDAFRGLIADPLGIRRYYLNLSPSGDPYMGGGIRLPAREFAKFGQLYLDGGAWKGRRILDESFVARAGKPLYELSGIHYGLQWWVILYPFRGDTIQAFFAGGNGGQLVMVIPKLDMVVATNAGNYSDPILFKLQRRDVPTYILPAVR